MLMLGRFAGYLRTRPAERKSDVTAASTGDECNWRVLEWH